VGLDRRGGIGPGHPRAPRSLSRVEHVGIAVGALELLFLPAALLAHPHVSMVLHDFVHPPHASAAFLTLLGANVGAVIMPWMVFYQQEAVIDRVGADLTSDRPFAPPG